MSDKNEIVRLELPASVRIRIANQITYQMIQKDLDPENGYQSLNLGFEVPEGWPIAEDTQPTMAQLVVFAQKLGMKITIGDLNLSPM